MPHKASCYAVDIGMIQNRREYLILVNTSSQIYFVWTTEGLQDTGNLFVFTEEKYQNKQTGKKKTYAV